MNLADAFRALDHDDLNTIYDNLPFVRALSQDHGNLRTPLRDRHAALAEALLLARDSFVTSHQDPAISKRRRRITSGSPTQGDYSHESEESSTEESDDLLGEEGSSGHIYGREQGVLAESPMPKIQARTSSTQYNPRSSYIIPSHHPHIPQSDISQESHQDISPTLHSESRRATYDHQHRALIKSIVFTVPPTVNPYDPKIDYLPQWLKRTYMYWRWTLKLPEHDIPQRYAVWISLHLNDSSIRYHIQNLASIADEGRFETSIGVNDYILKKAAGHIKVQEDIGRSEFNRLIQKDNISVITFNSNFLQVFNKVRHFYHPDRLAIQYYDRIIPRIRKRLSVSFYERYTTNDGSIRSRSFPTLEGLMLAAEQVDDYYRPLPSIPKKPTLFEAIGLPQRPKKLATKNIGKKLEAPREKLKTS